VLAMLRESNFKSRAFVFRKVLYSIQLAHPSSKKAKLPNMESNTLSTDFDVEDTRDKIYLLPLNVASETYVWSFQYRLLNNILFTHVKLLKIGLLLTDQCTFVI